MEELGSCVRNIKKFSTIYSGSQPIFEDGDIFRMIIPLSGTEESDEVTGKVTGKLNDSQQQIIEIMQFDPKITIPLLMEKLGMSESGIRKNIAGLKKIGKVERMGSDKNGTWKVIE